MYNAIVASAAQWSVLDLYAKTPPRRVPTRGGGCFYSHPPFSHTLLGASVMTQSARGYCRSCKQNVLITRPGVHHLLHLFLTIFTAGLWSVIWLLAILTHIGGWRCSRCGRKVARSLFS